MNWSQSSPKIPQTQIRQQTIQREGDWICYQCNNLNFSFRKRCNRCKLQTREQNQQYFSYFMDANHQWAYGTELYQDVNLYHQRLVPGQNNPQAEHIYFETNSPVTHQPSLYIPNPECPSTCLQIGPGIYSSSGMNWNIFLNKEQEEYKYEDNTLSDSSGQNNQENLLFDYQIEQMVIKIII